MKWSRRSRRFFLQGAGAALALPFLHSLLPKGAQAAEPKTFDDPGVLQLRGREVLGAR